MRHESCCQLLFRYVLFTNLAGDTVKFYIRKHFTAANGAANVHECFQVSEFSALASEAFETLETASNLEVLLPFRALS